MSGGGNTTPSSGSTPGSGGGAGGGFAAFALLMAAKEQELGGGKSKAAGAGTNPAATAEAARLAVAQAKAHKRAASGRPPAKPKSAVPAIAAPTMSVEDMIAAATRDTNKPLPAPAAAAAAAVVTPSPVVAPSATAALSPTKQSTAAASSRATTTAATTTPPAASGSAAGSSVSSYGASLWSGVTSIGSRIFGAGSTTAATTATPATAAAVRPRYVMPSTSAAARQQRAQREKVLAEKEAAAAAAAGAGGKQKQTARAAAAAGDEPVIVRSHTDTKEEDSATATNDAGDEDEEVDDDDDDDDVYARLKRAQKSNKKSNIKKPLPIPPLLTRPEGNESTAVAANASSHPRPVPRTEIVTQPNTASAPQHQRSASSNLDVKHSIPAVNNTTAVQRPTTTPSSASTPAVAVVAPARVVPAVGVAPARVASRAAVPLDIDRIPIHKRAALRRAHARQDSFSTNSTSTIMSTNSSSAANYDPDSTTAAADTTSAADDMAGREVSVSRQSQDPTFPRESKYGRVDADGDVDGDADADADAETDTAVVERSVSYSQQSQSATRTAGVAATPPSRVPAGTPALATPASTAGGTAAANKPATSAAASTAAASTAAASAAAAAPKAKKVFVPVGADRKQTIQAAIKAAATVPSAAAAAPAPTATPAPAAVVPTKSTPAASDTDDDDAALDREIARAERELREAKERAAKAATKAPSAASPPSSDVTPAAVPAAGDAASAEVAAIAPSAGLTSLLQKLQSAPPPSEPPAPTPIPATAATLASPAAAANATAAPPTTDTTVADASSVASIIQPAMTAPTAEAATVPPAPVADAAAGTSIPAESASEDASNTGASGLPALVAAAATASATDSEPAATPATAAAAAAVVAAEDDGKYGGDDSSAAPASIRPSGPPPPMPERKWWDLPLAIAMRDALVTNRLPEFIRHIDERKELNRTTAAVAAMEGAEVVDVFSPTTAVASDAAASPLTSVVNPADADLLSADELRRSMSGGSSGSGSRISRAGARSGSAGAGTVSSTAGSSGGDILSDAVTMQQIEHEEEVSFFAQSAASTAASTNSLALTSLTRANSTNSASGLNAFAPPALSATQYVHRSAGRLVYKYLCSDHDDFLSPARRLLHLYFPLESELKFFRHIAYRTGRRLLRSRLMLHLMHHYQSQPIGKSNASATSVVTAAQPPEAPTSPRGGAVRYPGNAALGMPTGPMHRSNTSAPPKLANSLIPPAADLSLPPKAVTAMAAALGNTQQLLSLLPPANASFAPATATAASTAVSSGGDIKAIGSTAVSYFPVPPFLLSDYTRAQEQYHTEQLFRFIQVLEHVYPISTYEVAYKRLNTLTMKRDHPPPPPPPPPALSAQSPPATLQHSQLPSNISSANAKIAVATAGSIAELITAPPTKTGDTFAEISSPPLAAASNEPVPVPLELTPASNAADSKYTPTLTSATTPAAASRKLVMSSGTGEDEFVRIDELKSANGGSAPPPGSPAAAVPALTRTQSGGASASDSVVVIANDATAIGAPAVANAAASIRPLTLPVSVLYELEESLGVDSDPDEYEYDVAVPPEFSTPPILEPKPAAGGVQTKQPVSASTNASATTAAAAKSSSGASAGTVTAVAVATPPAGPTKPSATTAGSAVPSLDDTPLRIGDADELLLGVDPVVPGVTTSIKSEPRVGTEAALSMREEEIDAIGMIVVPTPVLPVLESKSGDHKSLPAVDDDTKSLLGVSVRPSAGSGSRRAAGVSAASAGTDKNFWETDADVQARTLHSGPIHFEKFYDVAGLSVREPDFVELGLALGLGGSMSAAAATAANTILSPGGDNGSGGNSLTRYLHSDWSLCTCGDVDDLELRVSTGKGSGGDAGGGGDFAGGDGVDKQQQMHASVLYGADDDAAAVADDEPAEEEKNSDSDAETDPAVSGDGSGEAKSSPSAAAVARVKAERRATREKARAAARAERIRLRKLKFANRFVCMSCQHGNLTDHIKTPRLAVATTATGGSVGSGIGGVALSAAGTGGSGGYLYAPISWIRRWTASTRYRVWLEQTLPHSFYSRARTAAIAATNARLSVADAMERSAAVDRRSPFTPLFSRLSDRSFTINELSTRAAPRPPSGGKVVNRIASAAASYGDVNSPVALAVTSRTPSSLRPLPPNPYNQLSGVGNGGGIGDRTPSTSSGGNITVVWNPPAADGSTYDLSSGGGVAAAPLTMTIPDSARKAHALTTLANARGESWCTTSGGAHPLSYVIDPCFLHADPTNLSVGSLNSAHHSFGPELFFGGLTVGNELSFPHVDPIVPYQPPVAMLQAGGHKNSTQLVPASTANTKPQSFAATQHQPLSESDQALILESAHIRYLVEHDDWSNVLEWIDAKLNGLVLRNGAVHFVGFLYVIAKQAAANYHDDIDSSASAAAAASKRDANLLLANVYRIMSDALPYGTSTMRNLIVTALGARGIFLPHVLPPPPPAAMMAHPSGSGSPSAGLDSVSWDFSALLPVLAQSGNLFRSYSVSVHAYNTPGIDITEHDDIPELASADARLHYGDHVLENWALGWYMGERVAYTARTTAGASAGASIVNAPAGTAAIARGLAVPQSTDLTALLPFGTLAPFHMWFIERCRKGGAGWFTVLQCYLNHYRLKRGVDGLLERPANSSGGLASSGSSGAAQAAASWGGWMGAELYLRDRNFYKASLLNAAVYLKLKEANKPQPPAAAAASAAAATAAADSRGITIAQLFARGYPHLALGSLMYYPVAQQVVASATASQAPAASSVDVKATPSSSSRAEPTLQLLKRVEPFLSTYPEMYLGLFTPERVPKRVPPSSIDSASMLWSRLRDISLLDLLDSHFGLTAAANAATATPKAGYRHVAFEAKEDEDEEVVSAIAPVERPRPTILPTVLTVDEIEVLDSIQDRIKAARRKQKKKADRKAAVAAAATAAPALNQSADGPPSTSGLPPSAPASNPHASPHAPTKSIASSGSVPPPPQSPAPSLASNATAVAASVAGVASPNVKRNAPANDAEREQRRVEKEQRKVARERARLENWHRITRRETELQQPNAAAANKPASASQQPAFVESVYQRVKIVEAQRLRPTPRSPDAGPDDRSEHIGWGLSGLSASSRARLGDVGRRMFFNIDSCVFGYNPSLHFSHPAVTESGRADTLTYLWFLKQRRPLMAYYHVIQLEAATMAAANAIESGGSGIVNGTNGGIAEPHFRADTSFTVPPPSPHANGDDSAESEERAAHIQTRVITMALRHLLSATSLELERVCCEFFELCGYGPGATYTLRVLVAAARASYDVQSRTALSAGSGRVNISRMNLPDPNALLQDGVLLHFLPLVSVAVRFALEERQRRRRPVNGRAVAALRESIPTVPIEYLSACKLLVAAATTAASASGVAGGWELVVAFQRLFRQPITKWSEHLASAVPANAKPNVWWSKLLEESQRFKLPVHELLRHLRTPAAAPAAAAADRGWRAWYGTFVRACVKSTASASPFLLNSTPIITKSAPASPFAPPPAAVLASSDGDLLADLIFRTHHYYGAGDCPNADVDAIVYAASVGFWRGTPSVLAVAERFRLPLFGAAASSLLTALPLARLRNVFAGVDHAASRVPASRISDSAHTGLQLLQLSNVSAQPLLAAIASHYLSAENSENGAESDVYTISDAHSLCFHVWLHTSWSRMRAQVLAASTNTRSGGAAAAASSDFDERRAESDLSLSALIVSIMRTNRASAPSASVSASSGSHVLDPLRVLEEGVTIFTARANAEVSNPLYQFVAFIRAHAMDDWSTATRCLQQFVRLTRAQATRESVIQSRATARRASVKPPVAEEAPLSFETEATICTAAELFSIAVAHLEYILSREWTPNPSAADVNSRSNSAHNWNALTHHSTATTRTTVAPRSTGTGVNKNTRPPQAMYDSSTGVQLPPLIVACFLNTKEHIRTGSLMHAIHVSGLMSGVFEHVHTHTHNVGSGAGSGSGVVRVTPRRGGTSTAPPTPTGSDCALCGEYASFLSNSEQSITELIDTRHRHALFEPQSPSADPSDDDAIAAGRGSYLDRFGTPYHLDAIVRAIRRQQTAIQRLSSPPSAVADGVPNSSAAKSSHRQSASSLIVDGDRAQPSTLLDAGRMFPALESMEPQAIMIPFHIRKERMSIDESNAASASANAGAAASNDDEAVSSAIAAAAAAQAQAHAPVTFEEAGDDDDDDKKSLARGTLSAVVAPTVVTPPHPLSITSLDRKHTSEKSVSGSAPPPTPTEPSGLGVEGLLPRNGGERDPRLGGFHKRKPASSSSTRHARGTPSASLVATPKTEVKDAVATATETAALTATAPSASVVLREIDELLVELQSSLLWEYESERLAFWTETHNRFLAAAAATTASTGVDSNAVASASALSGGLLLSAIEFWLTQLTTQHHYVSPNAATAAPAPEATSFLLPPATAGASGVTLTKFSLSLLEREHILSYIARSRQSYLTGVYTHDTLIAHRARMKAATAKAAQLAIEYQREIAPPPSAVAKARKMASSAVVAAQVVAAAGGNANASAGSGSGSGSASSGSGGDKQLSAAARHLLAVRHTKVATGLAIAAAIAGSVFSPPLHNRLEAEDPEWTAAMLAVRTTTAQQQSDPKLEQKIVKEALMKVKAKDAPYPIQMFEWLTQRTPLVTQAIPPAVAAVPALAPSPLAGASVAPASSAGAAPVPKATPAPAISAATPSINSKPTPAADSKSVAVAVVPATPINSTSKPPAPAEEPTAVVTSSSSSAFDERSYLRSLFIDILSRRLYIDPYTGTPVRVFDAIATHVLNSCTTEVQWKSAFGWIKNWCQLAISTVLSSSANVAVVRADRSSSLAAVSAAAAAAAANQYVSFECSLVECAYVIAATDDRVPLPYATSASANNSDSDSGLRLPNAAVAFLCAHNPMLRELDDGTASQSAQASAPNLPSSPAPALTAVGGDVKQPPSASPLKPAGSAVVPSSPLTSRAFPAPAPAAIVRFSRGMPRSLLLDSLAHHSTLCKRAVQQIHVLYDVSRFLEWNWAHTLSVVAGDSDGDAALPASSNAGGLLSIVHRIIDRLEQAMNAHHALVVSSEHEHKRNLDAQTAILNLVDVGVAGSGVGANGSTPVGAVSPSPALASAPHSTSGGGMTPITMPPSAAPASAAAAAAAAAASASTPAPTTTGRALWSLSYDQFKGYAAFHELIQRLLSVFACAEATYDAFHAPVRPLASASPAPGRTPVKGGAAKPAVRAVVAAASPARPAPAPAAAAAAAPVSSGAAPPVTPMPAAGALTLSSGALLSSVGLFTTLPASGRVVIDSVHNTKSLFLAQSDTAAPAAAGDVQRLSEAAVYRMLFDTFCNRIKHSVLPTAPLWTLATEKIQVSVHTRAVFSSLISPAPVPVAAASAAVTPAALLPCVTSAVVSAITAHPSAAATSLFFPVVVDPSETERFLRRRVERQFAADGSDADRYRHVWRSFVSNITGFVRNRSIAAGVCLEQAKALAVAASAVPSTPTAAAAPTRDHKSDPVTAAPEIRSLLAREADMCALSYELYLSFGSACGLRAVLEFVQSRIPSYVGAAMNFGFVEPLRAIVRAFATAEYSVASVLFDYCFASSTTTTVRAERRTSAPTVSAVAAATVAATVTVNSGGSPPILSSPPPPVVVTSMTVSGIDVLLHVWDSVTAVHRSRLSSHLNVYLSQGRDRVLAAATEHERYALVCRVFQQPRAAARFGVELISRSDAKSLAPSSSVGGWIEIVRLCSGSTTISVDSLSGIASRDPIARFAVQAIERALTSTGSIPTALPLSASPLARAASTHN